jgi:hypothetical protein
MAYVAAGRRDTASSPKLTLNSGAKRVINRELRGVIQFGRPVSVGAIFLFYYRLGRDCSSNPLSVVSNVDTF